jgi:hypothetical protein
LNQAAVIVAELLTQLPDALHERVVGNRNIGPHGLAEFPLGDEAPGVLHEMAQNLECLGSHVDPAIVDAQAPTRQIELKTIESQNPMIDMAHSPSDGGHHRSIGEV